MRYNWFRSRGLFVGSGAVESGCKAVIGQRLKLSGMHWTVAGADAIAALRCREASSQWKTDLPRTAQPDKRRLTSQHPLNDLAHLQNWRTPSGVDSSPA